MAHSRPDKQALLAALAQHVLDHGLNTASLRPMAAAAGTSDRMLIYHFGSKDGLIRDLLAFMATGMAAGLDALLPPERWESEGALVRQVVAMMRAPEFAPYIRVWLDIVSGAAQGQTAHRDAGGTIVDTYVDWLAIRHPDGVDGAARALLAIEGALVLDAVGRRDDADRGLARLA